MRMGRPLFADFIAHTPVLHTGEAGQGGLDDLVGETMFNRIVEGQLILTRFGLSQNHTFLKLHKTRGWQRVILRLCQRPFTMVFSGHYTALRVGTFRQQGHGMESGWQHMEGGCSGPCCRSIGRERQRQGRRDASRFAAAATSYSRISLKEPATSFLASQAHLSAL